VVAAEVGEVPRILDGGRCGRLVPGAGEAGWVEAIAELLRPGADPRLGAEAGRARVVELYSSVAMARAYLDAYTRSAAAHGRR
jgi:glycosyltransferase involved in cell wall biosynthesis